MSLSKVLSKRQYGSTHIVFFGSFDQKTIWFNPYCLFRKFWPKDNMVQTILSLLKLLNKRQYGSTHTVFFESFVQKTISFNSYSPLRKFWQKDNMVQPILSFKKIFTKRQCGSTHIVFFESFDYFYFWCYLRLSDHLCQSCKLVWESDKP